MSQALAVSHGAFGRAAIYNLDRPITTHAHREGHLIFYISGAHAGVKVGQNLTLCDPKNAAAVSPWEPHSFKPMTGPCLCLVLYIKPLWFLESSGSADFALNFGCPQISLTTDLDLAVRRLTALMLSDSGTIDVESQLLSLTNSCYAASWARRSSPATLGVDGYFSDYRVRKSQRLMKDYLHDHNGLDALAAEVGLSRPHFFKLFKMQTGVTPNVYFNTLRSEQAIDDLTRTDKSVTNIADDLGFSSQASFTRFFSMNVGVSPTDYRRVAQLM